LAFKELIFVSDGEKKTSFITDSDGKPSDTRLKSWGLYIYSLIVYSLTLLMWTFDKSGATIQEYQIPLGIATLLLVGGCFWQLFGKVLETIAKRFEK
jgi:hypothetical protein